MERWQRIIKVLRVVRIGLRWTLWSSLFEGSELLALVPFVPMGTLIGWTEALAQKWMDAVEDVRKVDNDALD